MNICTSCWLHSSLFVSCIGLKLTVRILLLLSSVNVTLTVYTSEANKANSGAEVYVEWRLANGTVYEQELFDGVDKGEVVSLRESLPALPELVSVFVKELDANPWGYWKLVLAPDPGQGCDVVLLEDPNGVDGTQHIDDQTTLIQGWEKYWLGQQSLFNHSYHVGAQ